MDEKKPSYETVLGSPAEPIIVSLKLPAPGEHGFDWVYAKELGLEYGHFGFRPHPKSTPANVHVFGNRQVVEHLSRTGRSAMCALELVKKRLPTDGREFILVNLHLTEPSRRATHDLKIVTGASSDPDKRATHVFTTKSMRGVGVLVTPIG